MSETDEITTIIAKTLYAIAPCYTYSKDPVDWEPQGDLVTIPWDALPANDQDVQPAHEAKAEAIRKALAARGYCIRPTTKGEDDGNAG